MKPSSLGDIIHTLPAAHSLHQTSPQTKIDWLVNRTFSPLLEGIPFIEEVIPFDRSGYAGPTGWVKATLWAKAELRSREYDLVLDFQGLLRSGWFTACTDAAWRVGFRQAREGASWFYNERIEITDWSSLHAVDRNLQLAHAVGAAIADPRFILPPGEPVHGLEIDPDTILLHPFSRGPGKSLSYAEVLELCEALSPRPVILVGHPNSKEVQPWPSHVISLLGETTLPQLIHLIRESNWITSVDSGPMHLAAGITDHVLSLHTWSNPAMVGPWPKKAWVFRDETFVQVGDLKSGRFPEQRQLKRSLDQRERLFSSTSIQAMAKFLKEQAGK
ncbi:MAG: glycosyltransferase family 9 protein [Verrucomicrobiota bacterium]